jgi:hypothetical protein
MIHIYLGLRVGWLKLNGYHDTLLKVYTILNLRVYESARQIIVQGSFGMVGGNQKIAT